MRRRKPMKWFPFHKQSKPMADFEKGLDSFFEGFSSIMNESMPKINVREDEEKYTVEAEVPGLNKDEIELRYENGVLTISGEEKHENKVEQEGYVSMERSERKYQRSVPFDDENVDDENIKANLENGVLYVTLPKKTPGLGEHSGKIIDID